MYYIHRQLCGRPRPTPPQDPQQAPPQLPRGLFWAGPHPLAGPGPSVGCVFGNIWTNADCFNLA